MAKLVDALDLGSSGVTRRSSSLLSRTKSVKVYGDYGTQCSVTKPQAQSNW